MLPLLLAINGFSDAASKVLVSCNASTRGPWPWALPLCKSYLAREDDIFTIGVPHHSVGLAHEVLLLQQPCSGGGSVAVLACTPRWLHRYLI